ncbi:MAG TPA: AbrB/MazE/SpoVT family DNA-binding domain-containing protein [Spirochaetia bacterium]|nr:AbrB/MazE/SpoVT family DNA-binding domain-containing protein [Spirochaetia bacterium]
MQDAGKLANTGSVTVTTKGPVTMPSEIRKALGINEGDELSFEIDGDDVRILSCGEALYTLRGSTTS